MDNEHDMLESIKAILEKEGYKVSCFDTGQKVIRALKTKKFDLLILDIMMPDLSGWDVFSHARKINDKQKVIFVSVLEISPERKRELESYGLAEYITKPFDREMLVNRVKIILMADDKSNYV
jgi:DNA-binding response OmpR family regulator